jgi:hypothetical protein
MQALLKAVPGKAAMLIVGDVVHAEEPEAAVARIVEPVKTRTPRRFGLDPVRDIQVLCPMNRGGVPAPSTLNCRQP